MPDSNWQNLSATNWRCYQFPNQALRGPTSGLKPTVNSPQARSQYGNLGKWFNVLASSSKSDPRQGNTLRGNSAWHRNRDGRGQFPVSGEGKAAAQKCHFKLEQVSTSRTCQDTVRQELTAINQCSSKRTAEYTGFIRRGAPGDNSHLKLPYPNNCVMKTNLSKGSGMPFSPVLLHWSWSNARVGVLSLLF